MQMQGKQPGQSIVIRTAQLDSQQQQQDTDATTTATSTDFSPQVTTTTPWAIKNVALYFCLYLCQLLTDFQNSLTGKLCRQFAIMGLLYIPPHSKCVSTLPCEI